MLSRTDNIRKCLYFNECHRKGVTRYKDGYVCLKHYARFVRSKESTKKAIDKYISKQPKGFRKKYNDKWNKITHNRTLVFLRKFIILTFNPRTGYCSWCPNNIHDGSCKRTAMHHWFYLTIMPWACTEELCSSCHRTTHHRHKVL
jgi:hypothetical protein